MMAGDIINFSILYYSTEGTAKLGWVGRGGRRGVIVFFRVPNSLEGCDVWGEGGEYFIMYQSLGGTVERETPLLPRSSFRVRRSSVGGSIAQKGAAYPEGAA